MSSDLFSLTQSASVELHTSSAKEKGGTPEAFFTPSALHGPRIKIAAQLIAEAAHQGQSVLDLGCGYGSLADALVEEGEHLKYTGVDPVPAFIEKASTAHPNAKFLVGGIGDDLGVFDGVACLGVAALLNPGQATLDKFVGAITKYGKRWLVLEWQDSSLYKGGFTSWSKEQIEAALGVRITEQNTKFAEGDSAKTTLIYLA